MPKCECKNSSNDLKKCFFFLILSQIDVYEEVHCNDEVAV